jgi:hypothetical protein
MANPALKWISEAHQGSYLRATFIDCQRGEYKCLDDKTLFTMARDFARSLREQKIPISHFLFDQSKPDSLQPFLYKGAQFHRFPNRDMDFEAVIPAPDEWVYPKETFNGFTNPYSKEVLGTPERNPPKDRKSTLICAGFKSLICVKDTVIGSFQKATNPEHHRVIIALDATDLTTSQEEYKDLYSQKAGKDTADKIGFATVEQIITAIQAQPTPSQSSPPRPYMA